MPPIATTGSRPRARGSRLAHQLEPDGVVAGVLGRGAEDRTDGDVGRPARAAPRRPAPACASTARRSPSAPTTRADVAPATDRPGRRGRRRRPPARATSARSLTMTRAPARLGQRATSRSASVEDVARSTSSWRAAAAARRRRRGRRAARSSGVQPARARRRRRRGWRRGAEASAPASAQVRPLRRGGRPRFWRARNRSMNEVLQACRRRSPDRRGSSGAAGWSS